MDGTIRRFARTGHQPRAPHATRPWIGRIAASLALLVCTPSAAFADAAPHGRVIGGTPATAADVSSVGRWSAVVAVFATDAQGTRLCTGTLIAPNWVATAAHCVADEHNASVTVGAGSVVVAPGITSTQTAGDALAPAVSVHAHPGFSWVNASWDVALIELESTVPTIPFALPDPNRLAAYAAGSADNVAGFGRFQAGSSSSSGTLRAGRLEQVNAPACEAYNPGSGEFSDCYLPGPNRQATCFGDSGGPLVRFDTTQNNAPVLWGITSTGPDPCDAATAGQFAPSYETRVTAVLDWLRATMAGTTYVPKLPASARSGATPTTTPAPKTGTNTGVNPKLRAPAGGTGIGIFQAKLQAKPSLRRATTVTLASSFVGATGTGTIEIERCVRRACTITGRATVNYAAAGTTVKTQVAVPRCAKRSVITLHLTVFDTAGTLKDQAHHRLARC
jgi:secreted trypsin-like serine protease